MLFDRFTDNIWPLSYPLQGFSMEIATFESSLTTKQALLLDYDKHQQISLVGSNKTR